MHSFPFTICLLGFSASLAWTQALKLPADGQVSGKFEQTETAVTGLPGAERVSAHLTGPISDPNCALRLRGKTGPQTMGITVTLKDAAGENTSLAIRSLGEKFGADAYSDIAIALGWKGGWGRKYVRPNPSFYKPEEVAKRKADWDKLPGASRHAFDLELRPAADGQLELWFDGQFMNYLPQPSPAVHYDIALAPGASVSSLRFEEVPADEHLNLPVRAQANNAETSDARIEFLPKASIPQAFASLNGREARGIAVGGLGRFPGLATEDLVSAFWKRQVIYNLPEQRMFAVPLDIYSYAGILATFDARPGTVPEMTFRVTRYGGSGSNAMADTIVRVPAGDASSDPRARRVGTVVDGDKKTPLWLIKVPIRNGFIDDLLHSFSFKDKNVGTSHYLDIEVIDPLANVEKSQAFPPSLEPLARAYRPSPQNAESGITVYGIELERSPADLTVRSNIGIQVFYESDHPEFVASVKARESGTYTVEWKIADVSGKFVDQGSKTVSLEAGKEQSLNVPIHLEVGWYAAQFQLLDAKKTGHIDYRTSFVLLPPDTRKAGLESPYYGWWFQKNQRSDVKLEEAGPLLQRLGIRRVGLGPEWPESLTMKYGFTESTIDWRNARLAMLDYRNGKKTLPEAIAAQEASIRAALGLWPHADRMLVFHESGPKGAPFPSEIWGEPAMNKRQAVDENSPEALLAREGGGQAAESSTKKPDEWRQNWPRRLEYLTAMSKMVREKFPQLKMQYGNDGNSLGLMGELFRQKFPREFIDTIAIEDLGQTIPPERAMLGGFQSAWFLQETARKMGYGDIPITACTEWIGRMTEKLGLQKQAEWKVRDGLLALVYGFDTISIAGLNDASSGYYFTGWANGGLCFRYPALAPKPAYAAIATLTQVLDRAKFQRFVPTGSAVLYAAEFRQDDQWIYAIWTPRGERQMTLKFASDQSRILTDLYGRTRNPTGKNPALTATPAAQYVTSKDQIVSVKAGAASFPNDPPPEKPLQSIPLESLGEAGIVAAPQFEESSRARPESIPQLRQGEFELREVADDVMGKCLEVELKPGKPLRWAMEHEYVLLKLKTPVRTSAASAGLWIKGNGSWGEVDIQTTGGNAPWLGNSDLDFRWRGDATTNFEGWNFIRYPASGLASKETEVTGLFIRMPRQTLYGREMIPVENLKIRLKNILLF